MMKEGKIKTGWASLKLTDTGGAVVGAQSKRYSSCLYFSTVEKLRRALAKGKVIARKWVVSVPTDRCIFKALLLPTTGMTEASEMIEFELPSLLPLPVEELVYGCTLLEKQQSMLNVLVCIMRKGELEQILKTYKSIGIEADKVIFDSAAVQNWFNSVSSETGGVRASIFIGESRCEILSSVDGVFQKCDQINLSDKEDRQTLEELGSEIVYKIEDLSYSSKGDIQISLTGAKEKARELQVFLQTHSEDCFIGDVSLFEIPEVSCFENGDSEYNKNELCYDAVISSGLLASVADSRLEYLNLLPRDYLRRTRQKILLFNYIVTASLSIVLILLVWASLSVMNWRIERRARKMQLQIATIKDVAGGVESKREQVKAINQQLSTRGQITQIFEELYRYTPEAISINKLKYNCGEDKVSIEIDGQADTLSRAFEYSDAMSKGELLDEIQIINAQQIPRPGGSVVEFKANCVAQSE